MLPGTDQSATSPPLFLFFLLFSLSYSYPTAMDVSFLLLFTRRLSSLHLSLPLNLPLRHRRPSNSANSTLD